MNKFKKKKKKHSEKALDGSSKGVGFQQEGVERRQSVVWNYAVGAVKWQWWTSSGKGCSQVEMSATELVSLWKRGNDARIGRLWISCGMRREGERRREAATGNEVGVGKECYERPKPSSSSDVSFERRRREAAGKQASQQAVEENQSSVTARSRCRGKAAAPNDRTNDVIILSSSSSSPSFIVKFHVTANEQI
jgi:hypothetical protein